VIHSERALIVILRWIVAPIAALLAFLLVQTLFVLGWAKFGGDATGAYAFGVMFATLLAIWAGVATAPRRQWRTALAIFIAIIVSAMSVIAIWSALQGTLSALNFLDVGMSLAGSAFAFIVLRKRYVAIPAPD
jgi:hypothetical protein